MAYNGSGTFNRLHNWQQDADNSIGITPDRHDEEDTGFATGLTNCITRDGQSPATANIPFGGFKATGLAPGTALTDAATMTQLQSKASTNATTTGSANAYVLTLTPAITAYAAGQEFIIKANFTNTGAATINISGLGAKSLVTTVSAALVGGEIISGGEYKIAYDGTNFQLVNVLYNPTGGLSTIASATTTDLGTLTNSLVSITGTVTITSFGSSATLSNPFYFIRFTGALTLTYNASSLIIPGAASITTANGDTAVVEYLGSGNWKVHHYTKLSALPLVTLPIANGGTGNTTAAAAFTALKQDATTSATGVSELATTAETQTGTDATRVITPAGLKGALGFSNSATSSELAMSTGNQVYTFTHGLGAVPPLWRVVFRCKTIDLGYAVGDEVDVTSVYEYSGASNAGCYANSTEIGFVQASTPTIRHKLPGTAAAAITVASWRTVIRAWA